VVLASSMIFLNSVFSHLILAAFINSPILSSSLDPICSSTDLHVDSIHLRRAERACRATPRRAAHAPQNAASGVYLLGYTPPVTAIRRWGPRWCGIWGHSSRIILAPYACALRVMARVPLPAPLRLTMISKHTAPLGVHDSLAVCK